MKNKIYFIALDGAADRKITELNNRTPLESARTKYMDQMVQVGQMSLITILSNGLSPESDSGAMALLGYAPEQYYCGRGTLECMGLDTYKQYKYFVGFRINFASLNYKKGTLDRRTARNLSSAELQLLTEEIRHGIDLKDWEDIHFELKTFGTFRGIVGLYSNGQKLSGNVSNTDPGFVKQGRFSIPMSDFDSIPYLCEPLDNTDEAKITASIVNDFTKQCIEILSNSNVNLQRIKDGKLPANCILFRDGGSLPHDIPSFHEKYGRSLAIYGQLPCEKAIAELVGGTFYYTEAFELQLERNYLHQLARVLKKEEADVIFCHLKGADEPGHDQKPLEKKKAIEIIDECFFAELWDPASSDIYVISCDHATPCELGIHSNDKVPLLVAGNNIIPDDTFHFDESNASHGECPIRYATEILEYIIMENSNV